MQNPYDARNENILGNGVDITSNGVDTKVKEWTKK